MIETDNLLIRPMSPNEYDELAKSVIEPKVIEQILKGKRWQSDVSCWTYDALRRGRPCGT